MNQLIKIWSALSRAQQVSLVVVPLLLSALVFGLTKWKHDADFRVLYSSLAPEDASAVTQKIREAGIEFRLDETGATVLVPSERIADARLALAGAGLPRTGRIGFELFDRSNLGASDFAEQVNYRRALEGELERTVATLSEVEQARIHITFAKESVFLDTRQPSKASVVLRLKRSAQLPQASVNAIANLVASAVDGLGPEAVAIVDSNGRLLNRPRPTGDSDAQLAETNLDYRRQMEAEFLTKINSALGPLLGPERFRASVNVDCDFSSSEENEEIVDSQKTALLTSQSSEESSGAGSSGEGGTPGTASNLPRPAARASAGGSGIVRRTDNASYQPSRTVKRTISPKGSIRRISTAILVDQTFRWEGTGAKAKKTVIPPSAETLKGVHDIIAGITGFVEQRGDQITVETLPFESTVEAEPPMPPAAAPKTVATRFDIRQPAVIGGIAVIVLLLAGLAFALLRKRPAAKAVDTAPPAITQDPKNRIAAQLAAANQAAETKMAELMAENEARQAQLESEALGRIKLPENSRKTEVLAKNIRESVTKDSGNVTNVLRTWISDLDIKRTT
ncbi:MAG TPA: flagellar basal-body MS-ring/collar protein FliF [Bryobacteraceae bacterium]|jgi:flagellar M-ring protein FliF|nr:flagellar basal-body MS-ring/collar protein FliF [Bryobacteraceae bacterium]